ncbi:hypothetical protein J4429_05640 [Candidatus Pacearchaeota archaeon]|nr:hypothetical protein [Candidatus Pacearchaeota archaeon]
MEHEKILWLLNSIEENLINNIKPDISEARRLLDAYLKFECEFFYPKLDEEIPEKEKLKIFERIEEVIIE